MKINELSIINSRKAAYHLDIGCIHIFETFLVTEFNEGILLDYNKYKLIGKIVENHFSHLRRFGYIANRIHRYSTTPTELLEVKKHMKTIPHTAHVYYDEFTKESSIFESTFCPYEAAFFDNLEDAVNWVNSFYSSFVN